MSSGGGPGTFFARHPALYALSLSGAGTAVGIFAARAAQSRGSRRLGWSLLFVLEAAIFIGIVVVREGARRPTSGTAPV
jgi:hypothetical protein